MGKTHTYLGSVCKERNFRIKGCKWQVCVLFIYTSPWHILHRNMPHFLVHWAAVCVDLMESGFSWQCDRLLITCDQNSTHKGGHSFFFFFFLLPCMGMGDLLKFLVFATFLVSFFSFFLFYLSFLLFFLSLSLCHPKDPYWRTSHLELWGRCVDLGTWDHGDQVSGIEIALKINACFTSTHFCLRPVVRII